MLMPAVGVATLCFSLIRALPLLSPGEQWQHTPFRSTYHHTLLIKRSYLPTYPLDLYPSTFVPALIHTAHTLFSYSFSIPPSPPSTSHPLFPVRSVDRVASRSRARLALGHTRICGTPRNLRRGTPGDSHDI